MSTSSLYQGFKSCIEPVLTEPYVLTLEFAPPTSIFTPSIADNPKTESNTIGEDDDDVKSPKCGWSFLQLLTNSSSDRKTKEDDDNNEIDKVYVHPMVKRSSSALCEKSLEMCTESLGSETGSDVSESSDELSLVSSLEPRRQVSKSMGINFGRRKDNRRKVDYPPPLTSVSGSTGVQVRSHREGGRLILEAVTVSSSRTYFHAERSNGRLRLSLLKNCSDDIQPEEVEVEVEEEEVEEEEENETFDQEEEEEEKNEGVDDVDQHDAGESEEEEEDIEGNKEKVRGENGEEKLRRPSRCKEGLINNNYYWEQFWVAT